MWYAEYHGSSCVPDGFWESQDRKRSEKFHQQKGELWDGKYHKNCKCRSGAGKGYYADTGKDGPFRIAEEPAGDCAAAAGVSGGNIAGIRGIVDTSGGEVRSES